jgi:hypothetical protein
MPDGSHEAGLVTKENNTTLPCAVAIVSRNRQRHRRIDSDCRECQELGEEFEDKVSEAVIGGKVVAMSSDEWRSYLMQLCPQAKVDQFQECVLAG